MEHERKERDKRPADIPYTLTLSELKTNYLAEPLGIDIDRPVIFSWKMISNLVGERQTAYRIVVKEGSESGAVVWDSGEQISGRSVAIAYGFDGKSEPLRAQTKYVWSVTVRTNYGAERTAGSFFETGTDWENAKWITIENYASDMGSLLFRTEQEPASTREIASARLYITGLGAYDAYINGKRVSGKTDGILAPGWSDYSSYIHYQTYDVTDYLNAADKTVTLGAIVGSGWYGSSIVDANAIGYNAVIGQPDVLERCLLAKLVIKYTDGTKQEIVTDPNSWRVSYNSPYVQDGIYEGETYNAMIEKEMQGWNDCGYDDSDWSKAVELLYKGKVIASDSGVIYDFQTLSLKSAYSYNPGSDIISPADGSEYAKGEIDFSKVKHFGPDDVIRLITGGILIADFGQNAAATVAMEISAPAGAMIIMQPGEAISDGKDGEFTKGALIPGACKGRGFRYIASGEGAEIYRSRFHFTGYRYLEITSDEDIVLRSIKSIAVSSAGKETGFVCTSSDLLNRFIQNSKWSQASNFNSIPTDCPQREYYGWSGDAQIFAGAAMYHFDCARFFGNYIDIMNDYLRSYGHYGSIMPMHKNNFFSKMIGAGWSDAGIIIPWVYYTQTGDLTPVMQYWPEMTRYTDRINAGGYMYSHGDWNGGNERAGMRFLMCCYSIYINNLMSKMAEALGNWAEAEKYAQIAGEKRAQTIARYVTADGNVICASADSDSPMLDSQQARCVDNAQTALAWAILLKLYDTEEQRRAIVAKLVDSVRNKNQAVSADRGENTLATGFLGVHVLLPALSEGGRSDAAYDLMMNTDVYTFLYAAAHGATTTWERWDIWTEDNGFLTDGTSHNHYSYGVASEWVYKYILGIRTDENDPGFKHIILKPQVNFALAYANGFYESYYGKIVSNWTAEEGKLMSYHCVIPANTTATLYMPVAKDICVDASKLPIGIEFKGMTTHNGFTTAVFALTSGGFSFSISDGKVNVAIADSYIQII